MQQGKQAKCLQRLLTALALLPTCIHLSWNQFQLESNSVDLCENKLFLLITCWRAKYKSKLQAKMVRYPTTSPEYRRQKDKEHLSNFFAPVTNEFELLKCGKKTLVSVSRQITVSSLIGPLTCIA